MGAGPSKPRFTETEVADQTNKVFIVTGATSGVGRELTDILYAKNAKTYVAARSAQKARDTIAEIKVAHPHSKGELIFLQVDFSDLSGIKASASEFLAKEQRLDVLWNNAGVMIPPQGSKTTQGYELQLGTNNLGPYLFTKQLTPLLRSTAASSAPGTVRVVWVASSAAARFAPNGGVPMDNLDYAQDQSAWFKYGVSKAGNILHAREYARRHADSGLVSLALDPGNLATDLYKNMPRWQLLVVKTLALKPPVFGAYTELFAGLSPEVQAKHNGAWIAPFGEFGTLRPDLEDASKDPASGGTGKAAQFWDWTEKQIGRFE